MDVAELYKAYFLIGVIAQTIVCGVTLIAAGITWRIEFAALSANAGFGLLFRRHPPPDPYRDALLLADVLIYVWFCRRIVKLLVRRD
jgi:hypothetical protein